MTDKPETTITTTVQSTDREGRPGFIADLGFVLVVPWLVLWRFELPGGLGRSMWAGWWPVLVVVLLLGVALAIGVGQRKPRGFLPYNLRWVLLAATLVLPAWIAISLADLGNHSVTLRSAGADMRPAVEAQLARATVEDRAPARAAVEAVETSEKLADAAEKTEQQGFVMPRGAIPGSPAEAPALDAETQKSLEQAIGVAEAIETGRGLPPELNAATEDAGLDDAKILAALLVVAAALLAPLLGLSPALTLTLLQSLVAEGALTVGAVLRVAGALASSTLPGGGFDEAKVRENFERYGELAQSADILFEAAKKRGANPANWPLGGNVGGKAPDAKDLTATCRKRINGAGNGQSRTTLEELMGKRCPDLRPDQIKQLAEEMQPRGGKP